MQPQYRIAKLPLTMLRPTTPLGDYIIILDPLLEAVDISFENKPIDLFKYTVAIAESIRSNNEVSHLIGFALNLDDADIIIELRLHDEHVYPILSFPRNVTLH